MGVFPSPCGAVKLIPPADLQVFVLRDVKKQTPVVCLWWGPRRSQLLIRRVPTGLRLSGCQSSAATWRCDRNVSPHYSHLNMAKLRKVADGTAEGPVKATEARVNWAGAEPCGGHGHPIVR